MGSENSDVHKNSGSNAVHRHDIEGSSPKVSHRFINVYTAPSPAAGRTLTAKDARLGIILSVT